MGELPFHLIGIVRELFSAVPQGPDLGSDVRQGGDSEPPVGSRSPRQVSVVSLSVDCCSVLHPCEGPSETSHEWMGPDALEMATANVRQLTLAHILNLWDRSQLAAEIHYQASNGHGGSVASQFSSRSSNHFSC